MFILTTEECQSYFVENVSVKVEDEKGCVSVVPFELVGFDIMYLKQIIRINFNSHGSLS